MCPYSTLTTKHKYGPRTLIVHVSIGHLSNLYVFLPPIIYVLPMLNESLNHHVYLVSQFEESPGSNPKSVPKPPNDM